jgi:hypothetical protein
MAVASQSPLARVKFSLQVAGFGDQFGEHIYVTTMVPAQACAGRLSTRGGETRRCSRGLHRHRRFAAGAAAALVRACAPSDTRRTRLSTRCAERRQVIRSHERADFRDRS